MAFREHLVTIPTESITTHVRALAGIGNLGPELSDGFTRAAWSAEESAAMRYIQTQAEAGGFEPVYDAVGNLFLCFNCSADNPIVQVGSHLDTVVRGGLYDGGAGIIAGLEALKAISRSTQPLACGLQLVIWRGEESGTFGVAYKGSKAAFGLLPAATLEQRFRGQTLAQAICGQGFDPTPIAQGAATITQATLDRIVAHIELHIEQARKLETDSDDLGIVTSIRGPRRLRIELLGAADHSGATPMGVEYRRDANLALAYLQVALDELAASKIAEGADLVQTVGVCNSDHDFNLTRPEVYETGVSKIAGFAYCLLDIRSNNASFLERYSAEVEALVSRIAQARNVTASITQLGGTRPLEQLDPELQEQLAGAARALGLRHQRLACGAGHDVQIVAGQRTSSGAAVPCSLLLIPCRAGISHNPLEFTEDEAIAKGARVIALAIASLINQRKG